ncbi:hypothetical protein JHK84_047696 [Glycine max]|nr:hypothetical protein JHK84_047696 [Glycine max]
MCVKGGWWGKMVTSEEPFPVVDGKGLSNSMVNLVIRVCDSGQGYKGTNNEFESFSSQQGEQNEKADDDEDITSKGEDDEYDEDVDGSGDQVEEYEEYEDDDESLLADRWSKSAKEPIKGKYPVASSCWESEDIAKYATLL